MLNIRDGLYNEQFQIGKIAGTDTVNTITLTSESGDSSAVVVEYFASGSLNYIVSLTNTQHFVLAELTLRALNPSYCRVVYLEDTITNVILRNCRFEGVQVTTTNSLRAVIFTQNSTSHLVNKLHILDNVVLNGSIGMGLFQYGGSTEQYIIRGNSVMEFFSFGMAISKIHQVKVEDNYVSTTSPDCVGGIQMNRCDSSFTVTNNYIHLSNLVKFLWPGGIKGIDLKICRPDSSNRAIISNNSVIMGGVAYSHGIYVSGCDYNNIYNNSVHVKTTHPFASAFYISAGDSCRYMNNIFYNSGGGMVVKSSNWAANNTGSHNDIYTTGALIGRYQYENLTTIQDWRDSTGYDSISFAIDPVFSSDTDLHSNQVLLNNRGTPTPEVSYDMDGETRNSSTPDIGADEFIPDSTDALVAKFVQPFVVCAGSNDVKVIVRNNGLDTLSYLTVNWSVNQVIQTPFIWSGALESGDTAIVNLGAYSFTHGVPYELWAWTSAPNLLVDANPSNDSATIDTLFSSMTGTYTIGGVSPDYVNISSAVSDLVAYGVCGPVIFSIRTGTYNEQVRLPAIQNATLTNDITFTSETGDSTDVVWTYAATLSSARYTLSIDNARHINISKLTLKGTGPYAHVIEIPGGIDINISGCEVESIDTNIYSPRQGIGCGGDSITIVGNVIRYGTEGVSMGNCDNCTVSNNVIIDPFSYAIDVSQSDNLVIEKNNATTKYPVTGYPTTGIRVGNSSTIQLTNNLLDGSGFSIEFCDAALPPYKSLIANNFISTSTRGIFSSNNSDVDYYHNSVHVHTNGISDCFRYKGDDTSVVVKNNILANLAGGFTIYRESGVIKSDYNDLYSSGASIGYYFGARSTLSEWITLTKLDSNSINEDPQFLAPPEY
ncbi:MAG: right-handed parallel beta-helix repeat-containing protein [Colwellia sp.]|nr:right-handed parallel beta-helix repeat-containing protein [Colwellia sp.]